MTQDSFAECIQYSTCLKWLNERERGTREGRDGAYIIVTRNTKDSKYTNDQVGLGCDESECEES